MDELEYNRLEQAAIEDYIDKEKEKMELEKITDMNED